VPADPSSPIPAALTHLVQTDPGELQDADAAHPLVDLAAVPDPRAAHGRRHRLVAILAMAAAAVLAVPGRSPRLPSGPLMRLSQCGCPGRLPCRARPLGGAG
jgi:hypothetical protein